MAKRPIEIAKSGTRPFRSSPVRCRILLCHKGYAAQARTCPAHQHPFWQAEIIIHGPIPARVGETEYTLQEGDVLLVPPYREHSFVYEQSGEQWFSAKFAVVGLKEDADSLLLRGEGDAGPLLDALQGMLPDSPEPARRERWVLEHLLAATLAYEYVSAPEKSSRQGQPLLARIEAYVEAAGGARVSVSDVAGHVGYSISHVSALFRKYNEMPLKTFLDIRRSKVASRLLEYSDLTITEIAETLDFPDVFSFSRFFRRVVGASPRQFRQSIQAHHDRELEAAGQVDYVGEPEAHVLHDANATYRH
ncbi:MAG: AraC family transcriptional regulator [Phycisphaerae bacterium]